MDFHTIISIFTKIKETKFQVNLECVLKLLKSAVVIIFVLLKKFVPKLLHFVLFGNNFLWKMLIFTFFTVHYIFLKKIDCNAVRKSYPSFKCPFGGTSSQRIHIFLSVKFMLLMYSITSQIIWVLKGKFSIKILIFCKND